MFDAFNVYYAQNYSSIIDASLLQNVVNFGALANRSMHSFEKFKFHISLPCQRIFCCCLLLNQCFMISQLFVKILYYNVNPLRQLSVKLTFYTMIYVPYQYYCIALIPTTFCTVQQIFVESSDKFALYKTMYVYVASSWILYCVINHVCSY